ncbi:alpha-galactosidase [Sporolactobacillus shoreicorticis]|uniref:Alpha-galactosidase n=1 Tax=Sporolactobacillus shoreicorticis TaxID=1923877 RepID=A0ABW5S0K2_9BACL|nr:alpha-galactosidase [Sporolactobacillus shoreicorticis]MCO7124711.1 alpha-galactosidase [Sporolactobacillus shoreicorticis]
MIIWNQQHHLFHLQTNETSFVLQLLNTKHVAVVYWGKKLNTSSLSYIVNDIKRASYLSDTDLIKDFKLEQIPQIFPSFGNTDMRTPAFEFDYEDGSRITDLRYKKHSIKKGKKKIKGLPTVLASELEVETLELSLVDQVKNNEVILSFSVFENYNTITESVRVVNHDQNKLYINRLMSANIDFLDDHFDFLHLSGAWGRECHVVRRKMEQGVQSVDSKRGASGHGQNPFVALLDPAADETHGDVYALSLVYSGNFLAGVEEDMHQNARFQIGINPFDFRWTLNQGETFYAPEAVLVYSDQGIGKMSRTYHRLFIDCLMQSKFNQRERPILINNWEATYFDFNRDVLLGIAREAKEVGIELFVLDDGWFGSRDDDTSSLGDWTPNESKLGGSLKSLADAVNEIGLGFGIWFEPEMVSPNSKLYREHPDWAIHVRDRKAQQARHQYVLDLSNPEVQAYIIQSVSNVLRGAPITYVKWDMNRNLTDIGSDYLASDRQKEVAHRYILGLYSILDRITEAFPDVLFESCAGGGGRFDPGMLYYMPQNWTSDDTDAVERLSIQYGTSLAYPSVAMTCHVSVVPNHQVGRLTPIKTRATVAMQGNLGYELNLMNCDADDKVTIRKQISFYKSIRQVIQFGDLYRLEDRIHDSNAHAWMHLSKDKKTIVVGYVQILSKPNTVPKRLRLVGLNEDDLFELSETKEVHSGAELMYIGLDLPKVKEDFCAKQFVLTKKGELSNNKKD